MRSVAIAAASAVGAASAQTNNANVNAAINGCVNTCQPILSLSSQCGFPVPSDPTVALNPVAWGWGTNGNWGGNWGGVSGGNWGGWGGASGGNWGGWGGWKKRDVAGSAPVTVNNLNSGFLTGNWGGNWNNNVNCVCNTQSFDLSSVGASCLTCVNNALNANYGNPWLNLLATSCGFGVVDPNDYYGLGWKKSKRSPQDTVDPPPTPAASDSSTATPDAATLPVDTSPAAADPAADPAATPDSDGSAAAPPSLSQKGFAGQAGGPPSNGGNGGWPYGAVPAAVPVGGGAPSGGSSGNSVVPVSGGSSGGSSGGLGGSSTGGQPVFFAGAPKTSAQGMVGLAVAGSVVLFFGRALF